MATARNHSAITPTDGLAIYADALFVGTAGTVACKDRASAQAAYAKALKDAAEANSKRFELSIKAGMHGMELGAAAAHMEAPL